MNFDNINNLVELFFKQFENQKAKKKYLLNLLKDKTKIFMGNTYNQYQYFIRGKKKILNKEIDVYWFLKIDLNGLFLIYLSCYQDQ